MNNRQKNVPWDGKFGDLHPKAIRRHVPAISPVQCTQSVRKYSNNIKEKQNLNTKGA